MLKHLLITAVVLLSLTGCVTSEESIDESTTSSSSSTLSSSSSSLSSLVSSSSRSSISSSLSSNSSSMISSIVSSFSSSALSSSSNPTTDSSSSTSNSSSSSSSTDTIAPSSSSSSSTSSSISTSSSSSSTSNSSSSSSSISSTSSSSSITNKAPTASNVQISGVAKTGSTLRLTYTFEDADSDSEGASIIVWSTPTKELQRGASRTFTIPSGYEGDSIGAWVHPVDSRGLKSSIAYGASNNMLKIEPNIIAPITASSIIEEYKNQTKTVEKIKSELDQLVKDARVKTKVSIYGATKDDGHSSRESEITGVKYYFSTSGSDSNDGLSPLRPKKTMEHMQKDILKNLKPGDGILLKRGDVWRNYRTFTNTLKNLTGAKKIITCYGTGARPKLSKYVEIKSSWTKESNGLWSTRYTAKYVSWLLIDGKAERVGLTLNDLIAKKDRLSWYYDKDNDKLYLSVNPSGKNITINGHNGLNFAENSARNLVIDNLNIEGAFKGINMASTATGVEITNCTLGKHAKYGITISGQNNLIKNCIIDTHKPNFPNDDVYYKARYGFEGITVLGTENNSADAGNKIINCTIRDFEHGNISTGSINIKGKKSYNLIVRYNLSTGFNIFYGGRFSMAYNSSSFLFDSNLQIYTDQSQIGGENLKITNNIVIQNKQSHLKTAPYNHGNGFATNLQQLGLVNMLASGNVAYKLEGVPFVIKNKFNKRYGAVPVKNNTIKDNLDIDSCTSPVVYSASPKDIFAYINLDQEVYATTLSGNIVHRSNGNKKVIYTGKEEHKINPKKLLSFEEAQDGRVLDKSTIIYNNI